MQLFDFTNMRSSDKHHNLIEQLFIYGNMDFITHKYIKPKVAEYLRNKTNLKKIEKLINRTFGENLNHNVSRISTLMQREFGVQIKADIKPVKVDKSKAKKITGQPKYDYISESQKVLEQKIEELTNPKDKQVKRNRPKLSNGGVYNQPECRVDSTDSFEDNCYVLKGK